MKETSEQRIGSTAEVDKRSASPRPCSGSQIWRGFGLPCGADVSGFAKFALFAFSLLLCLAAGAQEAVRIEFSGNQKYAADDLQGIVESEWEKYLETRDVSYVDDAAYKLLQNYREEGHHFARVRYRIEGGRVVFHVKEGGSIVVEELSIVPLAGSSLSYPVERLSRFVRSAPLFGERYFVQREVAEDVAAIDAFYQSEGYLDEVSHLRYDFSPDPKEARAVRITVAVEEGLRVHLGRLEFEGNKALGEGALRARLSQGYGAETIFRARMQSEMALSLRDFYRSEGYAQASVAASVSDESLADRKMRSVRFEIREGSVCRVRAIRVQGNERTRESFVRACLSVHEGERYDLDEIRRSEDSLQRTQLFLVSEIEEHVVSEEELDLVVSLKERDSKVLSLKVGYSTTYGAIGGLDFEYNNLFGIGRRFHFSGESSIFGGELSKSEATARIIDPWFLGSETWSAQLKGFVLHEETPSFTMFERGSALSFRKQFDEHVYMELGYELRWSQVLSVEEGISDTEEGTVFLSQLSQKFAFNYRNDPSFPTEGTYTFVEFEESLSALGAEVDYFKVYWHTAHYFQIFEGCVLSLSLRGGFALPFGGTESIPIQRRFFSGGSNTVRSFKEKELPPWDSSGNPVGGEGLFLASAEIRLRLYGDFGISGFGDAGEIMREIERLEDYRVSRLRFAVGFSVWYNTLVGPIRFDMGFNPDRQEYEGGHEEDAFAWFISIGFSY